MHPLALFPISILKNLKNARCQVKISHLARLRRGSNITSAACLQSVQPSIVGLEQDRWETSLVQTHYPVRKQTHPKADFTPCSWPTCASGPISFQLLNLDHPNWMFTQSPPEFYLPFMIIFSLVSDGWEWRDRKVSFSSLGFWVGTRVCFFFQLDNQRSRTCAFFFFFFSGGEQPQHVPSARLAWTSAYFKALPLKIYIYMCILFKTKQNKTQCSWVDCVFKWRDSTKNGHSEGRRFRSFWPLERKAIS